MYICTCNLGNCESLISQSLVVAVVLWVMLVFSYMSIVGGWLIRTEWDQRDKRFRVLSQIELIHARLKGGTNIRSEPPWIAGFYSSSKPRRRRRGSRDQIHGFRHGAYPPTPMLLMLKALDEHHHDHTRRKYPTNSLANFRFEELHKLHLSLFAFFQKWKGEKMFKNKNGRFSLTMMGNFVLNSFEIDYWKR